MKAAADAGGKGGLAGYLKAQALAVPGPYLALLGKVLPTEVAATIGGKLEVVIKRYAD